VSIDGHDLDDEELKREIEDALGDVSLAGLSSIEAPTPSEPHSDEHGRIRGRIVKIGNAEVYVDFGGKSEAFLTLDDFEPDDPPKVGDVRDFVMRGVDSDSGMMRLSLREARTDAAFEELKISDVIEARVTGSNIGGLELMWHNKRCFMPMSQIDFARPDELAHYLNQKLACEITEIDRRGKSLIVSRRRVLERQREEAREQLRYTLAEGQVRAGVVRQIMPYGAFVDLGGIDGLLHISDMSYGRLKHPSDMLKQGDQVEVQVVKIDLVRNRISLGMKQLAPDPWNLVEANYRVGSTIDGRVTRLADFGAFVELEPGVEGLLPISELSWTQRVRHPRELLKDGDAVRVSIIALDPEKRRLTLSLKALGQDPWLDVATRYQPESVVSGRVTRLMDFGAFIELEEGVEGLAHISQMSDRHVKHVGDVVQSGQVVQCRILSVDPEQRRIALSLKSGAPAEAVAAEGATPAAAEPASPKKRKRPLRGGLQW